jgi:hypothetical protein
MNKLTTEQLLKPRYKVIADWPPSCPYEIGQVVTIKEDVLTVEAQQRLYWDKYPHLFRKLEWWEDRSPDEIIQMGFVKDIGDGEVFKVQAAHPTRTNQFLLTNKPTPAHYAHMEHFNPATLQEYTEYLNTQTPKP